MRSTRPIFVLLLVALLLTTSAACTSRYGGRTAVIITTGGPTGVYSSYGRQIADVLSRDLSVATSVTESNGSVDNLLRIGRGQAIIGFAQGDAAADAVTGQGAFDQPQPIRTMARLYDEYVHIVVRSDSAVHTIADLRGRTISMGAENSGVALVAGRILDAAGVPRGSVRDRRLNLANSIEAFQHRDVDGFFWVGGLPTPGIEKLANVVPIRLLPVAVAVVTRAGVAHAGVYRPTEIPVGVYGRTTATATMAVPTYLVTRADAPADLIHDATATLFAARSAIAVQVSAAALLDRRQAIFTAPVELHPGAVDFYREQRF